MADNLSVTQGSGTTIAADDISGVLHQRVKISQGADGVGVDVSSAAPLQVTLANTSANATAVKVDGSAVTQPVSGTVAVSTINSVAPAFGTGTRGATVQRVTVATDDVVPVSATSLPLPTGASTSALQSTIDTSVNTLLKPASTLAAVTTVSTVTNLSQLGGAAIAMGTGVRSAGTQRVTIATDDVVPVTIATNTPVGNVAHDSVDSGAPIKFGGRARTTEITAVATDDRTDAIFDKVGKQVVLPYAIPESFVSGAITTAMTGTTSTSLVAAPGSGLRNYITTIIVSNSHATVGTDVIIQDGSGGTTLLTIPAAAVYGGAVITLPTPLRQPTTATAIYCANVTTGASTKVSAVGYTGA